MGIKENIKTIYINNFGLKEFESVLIVTDEKLDRIGGYFYAAAKELGNETAIIKMPAIYKSGEEPPRMVAESMKSADVVLCVTNASLTHTVARKNASMAGARIGTLPGITEDMLSTGAVLADPDEIVQLTDHFTRILNEGNQIAVEKDGHRLTLSIEGRKGISSTGIFHNKGEAGNIPSGESYIAPIETSANGTLVIDGSIAGLGKVDTPILLTLKDGLLVHATGEMGKKLLELLGEGNGRKIAEFGIGANRSARITGVILEDEKVYNTIHVAFGSNKSFGGATEAGVHIDCICLAPDVYVDDKKLMFD
ncbi:aminopeptidase [Acidaminobacter hydrogenoformans]|uniref:Leucyl aminopeptidase (Aminopeptidase T) n=1 Tax=Acidaminobacter hydrogenoformans DSM 2784 TaxID=1120920 RepID=A0A1G5S5T1_9FIRM|nr:aminopeptidase [Acidaminobacter hydrogenoformans]SCZ81091.1 Leucyl aminopeptidase (aminopeptidase T) [Acidaminobacter hydrogenoformans DSM 2784]